MTLRYTLICLWSSWGKLSPCIHAPCISLAGLSSLRCCSQALRQGHGAGPGSLTGTWHAPWLSQGQTVRLPACKERGEKEMHRFYSRLCSRVAYRGISGLQLPTTPALSISGHGQTQRDLRIGEQGVSGP